MKNATLKLCVKTLALTIALLVVGPTVCHAEEQATAAVEVNNIVDENIDTKNAAMWNIPEEERTIENFGPGILLQQSEEVATPSEAIQVIEESEKKTEEPEQIKEANPVEQVKEIQNTNTTNRWGITLTPAERHDLAKISKLECGGESDLGQQAVVEVILNRMADTRFPNTLIGVLSQPGQFTTWPKRNTKSATPTAKEYANIDTVLNGNTHIFPSKTLFFSRGAQNKKIQARIGGHTFCNK